MQMINHGVSTGALFLLIGMLIERTGRARTADYGGLAAVTPRLAAVTLIIALSSLALPPTNGFVGEFLILAGTFQTRPLLAVLATFGTVVAAAYLLALVGRVFHGPVRAALTSVSDLRLAEYAVLLPLIAVVFWVGFYPKPLLMRSEMTVQVLLARIHAAGKMDIPAAVARIGETGR